MTLLLEQAIEKLRALPDETQDELAGVLSQLAGEAEGDVYSLSRQEEADLVAAEAEVARGELLEESVLTNILARRPR